MDQLVKPAGRNAAERGPAAAHDVQERWRADIDGLRAIAVVSVVVFHVAQSFLPGGYVGVDIFFVISGYLISRNIVRKLEDGSFKLLTFYEHRIRRIFPAYAAVLLAVLILVLIHDLPPDAHAFGKALMAAILSVTNIYFWFTTDYFAQPSEELPLLHTWSLSVEEQFYLLFPTLALLAWWAGRRWFRSGVMAVFAISLAASAYGAFAYPTATFYLLPTRAWELLLGTLLAMRLVPPLRSDASRNLAAGAGLVLLGAPMILLTAYSPFPGLAAVPPCLGAALILHAGESGTSRVARLLSTRPFVFVGLISYSLYLWHWPVLALHRIGTLPLPTDSKMIERGLILVLSFVLGTASWWFIERPTRNRKLVPTPMLLAGSGVVALGLTAASAVLIFTGGLPSRFKPEATAIAQYLSYDQTAQFREGRCFLTLNQPFAAFDRAACLPDEPGRPNHVIMGDSHAAALASGLREALPDANLLQVSGVACPPLLPQQPPIGRSCPELLDLVTEELPKTRSIDTVWLTARWNASRLDTIAGWSDWLQRMKQVAERLEARGVKAVVLGPSHEFRSALPRLLAEGLERGDPDHAQKALLPAVFELDDMMSRYAQANGIRYVSMVKLLCEGRRCLEYAAPGVPIFFDSNHFTAAGAKLAAERIRASVAQSETSRRR
ncbi:acyltransferase family protein [Bosea sp. BH3]|uniref:acyltransferase family protein n=1 Tax=Bosea sp. BH3 TaxID=2871701 RepID=UPI0021CB0051|nr:acyltransferase family protein [Bosea sp. BH3]MCU4181156.1 acyltransferase [Bosea sp. BH3]